MRKVAYPRYMISYSWTANGHRVNGTGNSNDYRPMMDGKPSVLTPAHVESFREQMSGAIREQTGFSGANVVIVSVWRWETDAIVSEPEPEPLDTV